jgi:hypothetical protein
VIGGSASKTVAIVATGPSLAQFGIASPLANPTLTLVRSSDQAVLATNDDWQTASNAAAIQSSGFAPSNTLESAILTSLPPGAYTAIVSGVGGGTGVAVAGVYEVGQIDVPLVNISTRGRVMTGNDVMIGGFVVGGTSPKTLAVVGTGPSLTQFGISNPLANPTLTLVRSSDQAVIATNDDWQTAANAGQLAAGGFAPSNALEPALLVTLAPGAYTAVLSGVGDTTGVGIVGVYEFTPSADVQPPQVDTSFPLDTAENMSVLVQVSVTFTEAMDPATLNSSTFTLTSPTGPVAATIAASGNSATLTPTARLLTSTAYTATVTTGARDLAGNPLAQNYVIHFSTRPSEPPPIVAGCPTPPASSDLMRLEWGTTPVVKRKSGVVTSFRVAQSQTGRASVAYTQGQVPQSPSSSIIDLTVSRCPGVIETNLQPNCSYTTTNQLFASITAFNRADPQQGFGCFAPNTEQYYVNVRWTFGAPCAAGVEQCGFSLQWGEGAY